MRVIVIMASPEGAEKLTAIVRIADLRAED
jgi:hypothetical protein